MAAVYGQYLLPQFLDPLLFFNNKSKQIIQAYFVGYGNILI